MREYLIYHMFALAAAIILDAVIGDPHALPHPIRAIGRLITALEAGLYPKEADQADTSVYPARGRMLWIIVMAVTATATSAAIIIPYMLYPPAGFIVEIILTFYILAAGSLRNESMGVYDALPDINAAKGRLSMIVGRDTDRLDEAGVVRAAVETVAENTSDGVLAPLIYTAIGGPVLGMLYKAVNTMDSMLGYHNSRYEYFGRFAAKCDDIANFVPSRLSALFMILSVPFAALRERMKVYGMKRAYGIWRRDRLNHKSPNSAQTESVCAGALGIRLGGDNYYGGELVSKPFIGDDTRPIEKEDIKRAIRLMFSAEILCTAVIMLIMLILIFR